MPERGAEREGPKGGAAKGEREEERAAPPLPQPPLLARRRPVLLAVEGGTATHCYHLNSTNKKEKKERFGKRKKERIGKKQICVFIYGD